MQLIVLRCDILIVIELHRDPLLFVYHCRFLTSNDRIDKLTRNEKKQPKEQKRLTHTHI